MIFNTIFTEKNRFYNEIYYKNLKSYYDLNNNIFKWSVFSLLLLITFIGAFQLYNLLGFSFKNHNFNYPLGNMIWIVDVLIVLIFTAAHLIIRVALINGFLVTIFQMLNKKNGMKIVKFTKIKSLVEQIYYFIYFSFMVLFGYTIFYQAFMHDNKYSIQSVWKELQKIFIPHSITNLENKNELFVEIFPQYQMLSLNLFYLVQISAYLYQLIYILLNLETKRKDYNQMIVHHVVTLTLTIGSYVCSFSNVGNLLFNANCSSSKNMGVENLKYVGHIIMIITDTTDLFLSFSKILNYLALIPFKKMNFSHKSALFLKSTISHCCDFIFLCGFVMSWILGRHILYNIVVYNCFANLIPKMNQMLKTSVIKLGFHYSHLVLVTSLVTLLLCLQSLQIIWFFMILKLVYKVLNKKLRSSGKQETDKDIGDIRSDDDDDNENFSESDSDTDVIKNKIITDIIEKNSSNKELFLLNKNKI
ncbi:hypothetical protein QEN19_000725 [Hanseniaspora menglaensis]